MAQSLRNIFNVGKTPPQKSTSCISWNCNNLNTSAWVLYEKALPNLIKRILHLKFILLLITVVKNKPGKFKYFLFSHFSLPLSLFNSLSLSLNLSLSRILPLSFAFAAFLFLLFTIQSLKILLPKICISLTLKIKTKIWFVFRQIVCSTENVDKQLSYLWNTFFLGLLLFSTRKNETNNRITFSAMYFVCSISLICHTDWHRRICKTFILISSIITFKQEDS